MPFRIIGVAPRKLKPAPASTPETSGVKRMPGLRSVRTLNAAERNFRKAQALNGDIGATLAEMKQGLRPSDYFALKHMDAAGNTNTANTAPAATPIDPKNWTGRFVALLYAAHAASGGSSRDIRAARLITDAAPARVRREAAAAHATTAPTAPIGFGAATPAGVTMRAIQPAPASAATSATTLPTLPPLSPAALMLEPDWIDNIEWLAFDEVAFLTACGASIDPYDGLPGRLRAMHACFPPQADADKLPLDITQFDQEKIARFVAAVMGTIGGDEAPYDAGDPAFSQNLFKRWFLQLASPQSGSRNGGLLTAPFQDALLRMTHPSGAHRRRCGNGDRSAASSLPRIGLLKKALRQKYLRSYRGADTGPAREWAFEGLCQIFAPAMLMHLPEAFRYGSLAWALLSIGIDLAGDAHAAMTTHALIALGAASSAHYFGDAGDEGLPIFGQKSIEIILKMAHAQGAINIQNMRDINQKDLETALSLFVTQLFAETEKQAPLETLIDRVPTRHAVAEQALRERGIDPRRRFFVPDETDGSVGTKRVHRVFCPADPDRCKTATELYMRGELSELRRRGGLDRGDKSLPDLSGFTLGQLSQRFNHAFDAAFTPLAHEIMVPALQDQVEFMDAESEEFWRCGEWTVRIPSVDRIETQHKTAGVRGTSGIGASSSSAIGYTARDNVLIRLSLGTGAAQRTQTWWARLEPFQLQRYRGNDKALLESALRHFFKPAKDGDVLLRLNSAAGVTYEDHTAHNGNTLLQTVSTCLLKHRSTLLRDQAYQITAPEQFKQRLWESVKSLLPLYSCIKAGIAGDAGAAAIYCTLDMLSMIPAVSASTKLSKALFASGSRMGTSNMRAVARAFMANVVEKSSAHQTIRTVLTLGKPAANAAKAGLALIDPGFGLLYGLARLSFQLGPKAWLRLKNTLEGSVELGPFLAQLKEAEKLALICYPDRGFWRARPEAIAQINGLRGVAIGGKIYEVGKIGNTPDVLMLRDGAELRLANPQSGRGFGPVVRRELLPQALPEALPVAFPETLVPSVAADGVQEAVGGATWEKFKKAFSVSCRSKRAGDAFGACSLLPDRRFGPHGYARNTAASFKSYQIPLTDVNPPDAPLIRLRTFDAVDLGYATQVEGPAGGRADIVPDSSAQFVHRPDGINSPQSPLRLPDTIHGQIQSLPSKDGAAVIDYAVFTISHRDGVTGATIHATRYVPLGTYRERDGAIVAIAYCDPWTPYSARLAPAGMPPAAQHVAIELKPAGLEEIQKFWRFQRVLSVDQRSANPLVAEAVQLRDETAAVKAKFAAVFDRGEAMLNDAIGVMEDERLQPLIGNMGAKLCGMEAGQPLNDLLNAIWAHLTAMRDALPYLREQSPHVIGFFEGVQNSGGSVTFANALSKSMDMPIDFREINKPLITFERRYFMSELALLEHHAATLLHEWLHALRNAIDRMDPAAAEPVYAFMQENTVDLSGLTAAAMLPGSQPANHAPTIEHFLTMAASLRHEATKASVMAYIQFPDSHSYQRTTSAFDIDALVASMEMTGIDF